MVLIYNLATPFQTAPPTYKFYNRTFITVTWRQPEDDGGADISSYTIFFSEDMLNWNNTTVPAETFVYHFNLLTIYNYIKKIPLINLRLDFPNLQPETVYFFMVLSTNEFGSSPASAIANISTAPCIFQFSFKLLIFIAYNL